MNQNDTGAGYLVGFLMVVGLLFYGICQMLPLGPTPLYDLNLRWGQKVGMDDVFYGHCEGTIVNRTFDSDGIPHYFADLQCRSVAITHMDWTVYVIRKYAP